eukprot:COSAG01_NODE_4304_length_5158_cov_3.753509_5_plen_50_part_00
MRGDARPNAEAILLVRALVSMLRGPEGLVRQERKYVCEVGREDTRQLAM